MNEIIESIDIYSNKKIDYIINLPDCYYDNSNKLYPMILFLHGAGERGDDIYDVKKYGIHKYINNKKLPFIILSPQCKANNFWDAHLNDIELVLDKIKIKYRVDCNKICVVGISLGAYGAWNFAMQRPNLFKCIVSIAGGAMLPKYASLIKHIPTWIFHGKCDKEIKVEESIEIAETLKKLGGDVRLSIIPNTGHELCTKVFERDDLYEWILQEMK